MSESVCRTCLGKGKFINIFYGKNSFNIAAKLMSVTNIQISLNDDLPQVICTKCLRQLKSCWNFIEFCVENDSKLKAINNHNSDEDTSCVAFEHQSDFPLKIDIGEVVSHKNSDTPQEMKHDISCRKENVEDKTCGKNNEKDNKKVRQQCFTCGKVMSSKFRLKTHLLTHTGEKPYSCPHCNRNFSLAQNLKVHLRTHTGEKPLKCLICGAGFAQSAGLAAHRRKHTGQKPYQCTLCPRNFRTIGHLQYHTRGHTGEKKFECETCTKCFITRSDLKQHSLSHSKQRLHICKTCGVRVSRASHLKRHVQHAHDSKIQLECTQCNMTFANKFEYRKHKKNHAFTNEKGSKETEITIN